MLKIKPTVISGNWIDLEPLNESHKQDLHAVAQDQRIWAYNSLEAYEDRFTKWFDSAMENMQKGLDLPYVVRQKSDHRIVGSTRYYDINTDHRRLTIGYTWYAPEVWGTFVNPECKFLLLHNVFDVLHGNRVEFVTDERNMHSRSALKKLGAKEEGVLRQHMILEDGFVRDTVVFSIVKPEWPALKEKLEERLQLLK